MTHRSSFRDIKAELTRRIASRQWAAGVTIPGEESLAREFGAARATVNRALRELAEAGVVERKRKAGTRVVLHPEREARLTIPLVKEEIEASGAPYRYRLSSRRIERVPPAIATRSRLSEAKMLHVRCLHFAGSVPYQLEDRWINISAVPEAKGEKFKTTSPGEWLIAKTPLTGGEVTFFAARATAEERDALGLRRGEAVFVTERVTWLEQKAITFARLVHPPSHRVITRL